jgi:hypothetical protein
MAGRLLKWIGRSALVLTVFAGFVYAVGCIVWLHAPIVRVLLATIAMMLPFLGLAWLLGLLGRRIAGKTRQPWFEVDPASGRMDRRSDQAPGRTGRSGIRPRALK